MESAITVTPLSDQARSIKLSRFADCAESRLSSNIRLHTLNGVTKLKDGENVTSANFLVIIENNSKDCFKDQFLLAAAAPCFKGFDRFER